MGGEQWDKWIRLKKLAAALGLTIFAQIVFLLCPALVLRSVLDCLGHYYNLLSHAHTFVLLCNSFICFCISKQAIQNSASSLRRKDESFHSIPRLRNSIYYLQQKPWETSGSRVNMRSWKSLRLEVKKLKKILSYTPPQGTCTCLSRIVSQARG